MQRNRILVTGVAALLAGAIACTSDSSAPLSPTPPSVSTSRPADGSTLKASTPSPQSPINDRRLDLTGVPTLVASTSTATFGSSPALQYRFQLLSANGTLVRDSGLLNSPSWPMTTELDFDTRYTWRVRSEFQGDVTPWSATASFLSADGGFIRGSQVFDPLTNSKTVGRQNGGRFVAGRGWMATGLTDSIDYDIATCSNCRLEFDVTNFGKAEGESFAKDLKWITMGDGTAFGEFNAFRDHDWKMHLEQRSDGNGTGMKLIWRNGRAGGDDPGDHTQRNDSTVDWRGSDTFHFVIDWTPNHLSVSVNGREWFEDGFSRPYAPPNHRISLGCAPRAETFPGAIWSNVKVTPR